jgi:hypothetical protein
VTREDLDLEREQKCEAIGDLVAAVIPPTAPGTQALPPESVALAMTRQPRPRLRAGWKWAPALAIAAAAAIVAFPKLRTVLPGRPLSYELTGSFATHNDGFETPAAAGATARFTDGTSIAVGARSVARVKTRTRKGATIQLDRGRASFAVVHHPGADWHVEVGPYDIAVTGTEFDVRWSDNRDRFEVMMKSGSIVVRGALTGAGIPLRAGQRLVASLTEKTLVVNEITSEQPQIEPPSAPPSAMQVAPSDEAPREEPPRARRERAIVPPPPAPEPPRGPPLSALSPPPFEPAPLPRQQQPSSPVPETGPPPPSSDLNQGGATCTAKPQPQLRFDHAGEGFRVLSTGAAAVFSNPVVDHTHSWCGGGSLRFDASFDTTVPQGMGEMSSQSGEAVIFLPRHVDLRGRTVTLRFMVRGPFEAEFTARILAGQGGLRTGNSYTPHLTTGSWWTVSATFHEPPPGFGKFESQVYQADRVILKIDATGDYRVWSGLVYVDDISWR